MEWMEWMEWIEHHPPVRLSPVLILSIAGRASGGPLPTQSRLLASLALLASRLFPISLTRARDTERIRSIPNGQRVHDFHAPFAFGRASFALKNADESSPRAR